MFKTLLVPTLFLSSLLLNAQEVSTQWLCPSPSPGDVWGEKALVMFDYPSNGEAQYFLTESLSLITLEDGSHVLEGKLPHRDDTSKGLDIYVELSAAMDWETWSNQPTPTSYLDDNNNLGDFYLDWDYLLIQNENSIATGYGAMEGTSFGISHAPSNGFYGIQIGTGAHQADLDEGIYGWCYVSGTYVDSDLGINDAEFSEGGTFSFTFGCEPESQQPPAQWLCSGPDTHWGQNGLMLLDFPDDEETLFDTDGIAFYDNEDGTAYIEGSLVHQANNSKGLDVHIELINGMNWEEWSNQPFPTNYLDDNNNVGDNYLDWTYYVIDAANSNGIGFGAMEGTSVTFEQAPDSFYYGFQIGLAAHQEGDEESLFSWCYIVGTYIDTELGVELIDTGIGAELTFIYGCEPSTEIDETAPVPDISELLDIVNECDLVTLESPTANDDISGVIIGVSDTELPIEEFGTTTITWTFTDEAGNVTTQTQDVTIQDTLPPEPSIESLEGITSECPITVLDEPIAVDLCSDDVSVSSDAIFPISDLGTTSVTWTFDDGNGNTSSQTQTVTITEIDNAIAQSNSNTLAVSAQGYTYQWIDCENNNTSVEGATEASYTPGDLGLYACEISNGTCTVVTNCISLAVGIEDIANEGSEIWIYPNPASTWLTARWVDDKQVKSFLIHDSEGRLVASGLINQNEGIDVTELSKGMYILTLEGLVPTPFVKE